jgi:thiosulfate reductase cytochrome b subunit
VNLTTREERAPRSRWASLPWAIPAAIVAVVGVIVIAQYIRILPPVEWFMQTYRGASELPAFAPVGFPAFVEWQHGLNTFFLLFIIRTGWDIRRKERPAAYWTRRNDGLITTARPPIRLGVSTWLHLAVDALWVLNGILFYVLIFCTGQWTRIIPTSWDVFPNAISTAIQCASLYWPTADGWSNYNALQLLSYFVTVFIAAPLAIITGVRMMPGLALRLRRFDRVFPLAVARGIHVVTMVYFVAFTVVHVTLVLATGAAQNLNHMYAGRNDTSLVGAGIFAASVIVMVVLWIAAKPAVITRLAGLTGTIRKANPPGAAAR